MTDLKIEMSTAVSSASNHAAERERFLEEYERNMARLVNASEGFRALQELLDGYESRGLPLSDSGRSGLALILRLLVEESESAWGSLPMPAHMRAMLEGVRHE